MTSALEVLRTTEAAAIAALIKSRNLAQTAAQVKAALLASVIDIHSAGVDRNSGAGIIMANTGVQAVASSFTDDPLQVGVTAIKAVHFTELRSMIDSVRSRYGLGAYGWTDAALTAGDEQVRPDLGFHDHRKARADAI